jgi:hypothetical protein
MHHLIPANNYTLINIHASDEIFVTLAAYIQCNIIILIFQGLHKMVLIR